MFTRFIFFYFILGIYSASGWALAPSFSDLHKANTLLKTDALQSWRMFENALPYFNEMGENQKMDWYKLGVQAATNLRDIQRGWNVTKMYYDQSWKLADRKRKLFIIQHFARLASITQRFDQALELFNCAEQFQDDVLHRLSIANNKGAVLIQTAQWEKARAVYLNGIALAEEHNHQNVIAAMSNNIGEVWTSLNELNKALEAYKKSYVIKARIADETSQLSSLSNLMRTIFAIQDWQQWNKYYPLYLRLLNEVGIKEFQAIHDWMIASKAQTQHNTRPGIAILSSLTEISKSVQAPDNKAFINDVAQKMNIKQPFDMEDASEQARSQGPDLNEVITSCLIEISEQ